MHANTNMSEGARRSSYRGVYWHKDKKAWACKLAIRRDGKYKNYHGTGCETEEEAAGEYDQWVAILNCKALLPLTHLQGLRNS